MFGGKDFFVAISEANPTIGSLTLSKEEHRSRGIAIADKGNTVVAEETRRGLDEYYGYKVPIRFPVFTDSPDYTGPFNIPPLHCENQGDFFEDEDPFIDEELR